MSPLELLAIAGAGGLGAVVRFLAGAASQGRPVRATIAVNLAASLLVGLFAGALVDEAWRAILVTGFCGGMSTYSAFAVQAMEQVERRRAGHAAATVAITVVGGALAAGLGLLVGALLSPAMAA
ncbi:fluoride efflux transporter FluC [Agrococcus terreus]|uniref:Fluoride-specific ion channel FluC n=1 Tax=Agrococcus terreus TaxID=574649 RepID=A0ABQ2KNY9_9MICO|nr:CrcB family protein [Agrococcus terreus]GGN88837.1 putative fluoride ion transporter CrcB [Agrococcus terreus]